MRELYEQQLIRLAKEANNTMVIEEVEKLDARRLFEITNTYLHFFDCMCFTQFQIDSLVLIMDAPKMVELPEPDELEINYEDKILKIFAERKASDRLSYFLSKRN